MTLTPRQRHVLQLIADDLKHERRWDDRVLTGPYPVPGQEERITWEEMLWLIEVERAGMKTRIEAMLLVAAVHEVCTQPQPTNLKEKRCQ